MPGLRGSDAYKQSKEEAAQGGYGFKGWIKDRMLVGYKFSILQVTFRKRKAGQLPSGDWTKEADEVLMHIVFEEDPIGVLTTKGESIILNETYGCGSTGRQIVSLFEKYPAEQFPIQNVTIREDKSRPPYIPPDKDGNPGVVEYYPLYIDDYEPDVNEEPDEIESSVFDEPDNAAPKTVKQALEEPMTKAQFLAQLKSAGVSVAKAFNILGVSSIEGINYREALVKIAKENPGKK